MFVDEVNPATVVETGKEYTQDIIFGIAFFVVAILALWRMLIYFDPNGGGKVITAFYGLIFSSAFFRSVWFFIPKSVLEGNYTPVPVIAFISPHWEGVFISEILLAMGSLSLFAVFILIVCYWAHMLKKVENEAPDSTQLTAAQRSLARYPRTPKPRRGPMQTFAIVMVVLLLAEVMNVTMFLLQIFNSEGMILFDSILMSIVSFVTLVEITIFSHRIRIVLMTIGVINANSTKPQVRRILAITVAANIFFMTRVLTEVVLTAMFLYLWKVNKAFYIVLSNQYWDVYINVKHWAEVVVLILELVISTAIKSQTSAATSTLRVRRRDYQRVTEMKPMDSSNSSNTSTAPNETTSLLKI